MATPPAYRVLVTGSAGAIGRIVCTALQARGHRVRGLDLSPTPGLADSHLGPIEDPAIVNAALAGMDTVIHLAATVNDADFMTKLLQPNIVGVFNILDAAQREHLRRVVLASSAQVVSGLWRKIPGTIRLADGLAPTNHYGVTKIFAEAMGQMYATRHSLSILAVRIGWLMRNPDEAARAAKGGGGNYLSPRDAADFFVRSVEAQWDGYQVVFAVSRVPPGSRGLDIDPARQLLGYEPQDTFPEGLGFELPPPPT